MVKIIVGIDIAKNVFQVHAADGTGATVYTKKLSRGQVLQFFAKHAPALIGMEACATSHHWARELIKLGHEVRLLPPTTVKPFVKRGKKNDAADAAAICEAMVRPNIHSVPVKTEEQQSVLALHTVREQLVGARTSFANSVRAHFAEHGIVVGLGRGKLAELAPMRLHLPDRTAFAVDILLGRIEALDADIARIEKKLMEFHKTCEESCNLATIPSVGPLTATLIVAKIGDPARFKRGRNFAAWLGMVPRQNSSGGKDRLGAITKAGDQSIRRMLFLGLPPWCGGRSRTLGSASYVVANPPSWRPWRRPTRPPGLSGRCSFVVKSTARQWRQQHRLTETKSTMILFAGCFDKDGTPSDPQR